VGSSLLTEEEEQFQGKKKKKAQPRVGKSAARSKKTKGVIWPKGWERGRLLV